MKIELRKYENKKEYTKYEERRAWKREVQQPHQHPVRTVLLLCSFLSSFATIIADTVVVLLLFL